MVNQSQKKRNSAEINHEMIQMLEGAQILKQLLYWFSEKFFLKANNTQKHMKSR